MKISLSRVLPFALSLGLVLEANAIVNYPFPQNSTYNGRGITLSNKTSANTSLKSGFQYYLSTFYNSNGTYAGIRSNAGSNEYFSEGIGYGMLLMVYFSDQSTSYQSQFDKLFAFYKASHDTHGLMNWKMGNLDPTQVWGQGAATDAEMDVAAALILAAWQFGDNNYMNEAATLLSNVRQWEFETNGLHKPGDSWNDKKNPSYITPAYFELFKIADPNNAAFWDLALTANYTLLEANSNQYSTGLFDNWSDASGSGLDIYYGYDAARAPWRLSQAYYWYGHAQANTMLNKLGTWVASKSASSVKGSIQRSGSMGGDHNSTFVATLMTSLVTNSANQAKLDEYWNEAVSLGNENYFNQSMKLLCGLAVSGNMPAFGASPTATHAVEIQAQPHISAQANQIILDHFGNESMQVDLLLPNGQVASQLYTGHGKKHLVLSLGNISSGLYLVRVQQNGQSVAQKVILP